MPANAATAPATPRVTVGDVRHIAELANLRLTAEEEPAMQRDLNAILVYVEELNQLDTTSIAPMAQVGELLASTAGTNSETTRSAMRADVLAPSLDRADVMTCAPDTDGVFFKVPKVIER